MTIKLFFILLLLSYIPQGNLLFNPVKKLKEKINKSFKMHQKDKTWNFLGYDMTEYPGTDSKYRRMHREKWNDYYKCLAKQNGKVDQSLIIPEAIVLLQSNSIRLQCKLCVSPEESILIDSTEWFWAEAHSTRLKPVEYAENVLLSPLDRALEMYNMQTYHSGQYLCKIGEAEASPIFVTVADIQEKDLREVHPSEAPHGPYPEKMQLLENYNIIIDTKWLPWSGCSNCEGTGKKYRFGFCIVKYDQGRNVEKSKDIPEEHYEVLKIFKHGLPCNSHVLPYSFRKLNKIKGRQNEIMSTYCKIKCKENEKFTVQAENGTILEEADNSVGIYSSLQDVPKSLPKIERITQYAEKGNQVTIACPGNLNSDVPVQWQMDSKKLIAELIIKESQGRIFISITDRVHIREVHISDSHIYSCWQHGDLAGTVRLVVETKTSLNFNHHIMLLGAVSIFSVFFYIIFKAFLRQKSLAK